MTNEQLKALEAKLWDSANSLRAYGGIKASDYAVPVLGLIFLRFAENKYSQFEAEIQQIFEQEQGTRMERTIEQIALEKCGFYLPQESRYDELLNLPEDKSMAKALQAAMEGIEKYQDAKFQDVLPKEAYFDLEKKKEDILPQLLKTFSDISKEASGDVFGKIYEYFLGKFAMSEGQKGGEFFTPTSVVRFIVEVIEPYCGKLYDPACGSGGMFVQSATFIRNANQDLNDIYVCGQEHMGETVRLAKMNLLVNNLRGEIVETNSYDSNPFESLGKFDYVMANPPFNVKSVKASTVKEDARFTAYGLPKNKGKKGEDNISDANYLWISLFATSLNETGRAGFVMPNSASDARNAEYEIRKNIVDSGIVDCMVSMPSNMFLTVTLPATLWFFDKQKVNTDREDQILFLDARNVYRQIDRAHREWTEEQQQNLAAIVRLYRGETKRYLALIGHYLNKAAETKQVLSPLQTQLDGNIKKVVNTLRAYAKNAQEKLSTAKAKKLTTDDFFTKLAAFEQSTVQKQEVAAPPLNNELSKTPLVNEAQQQAAAYLLWQTQQQQQALAALKQDATTLTALWKLADKSLKLKSDKKWSESPLNRADKLLEASLQEYTVAVERYAYWHENIAWLHKRFPNAHYQDVVGLCKVANKNDYAEEQDYSLNAGRYVGVEIEDDNISEEEFRERLGLLSTQFNDKTTLAYDLEVRIKESINSFI